MFYLIAVILIRIGYTDIRFRIIENKCVLIILLINVFKFFIGNEEIYLYSSFLIFSVGLVCILTNCVGAGDIKLLTVLGMVFPPREIPDFIFLVTVSGLPLILIVFLLHRFSKGKFSKTLPYGVAIISGYLLKVLM
ncbi:A24 family peptidase [Tatumella ptyseos]|uniref:A24 family peptidase n=1 Tax=Tatumella ptyseos TaxID=82987 RepID=UPI0034E94035